MIGITGTNAAGKGEVVDYLKQQYGFNHYSASAYIALGKGNNPSREVLIETGNKLRSEQGADIIASQLHSKALVDRTARAIFESLRHPAEIKYFRAHSRFRLYVVDAAIELRYARSLLRGQEKDNTSSLEKFRRIESIEIQSTHSAGQNLLECMKNPTKVFLNNGTREELYAQIDDEMLRVGISKIMAVAVPIG